MRLKRCRPYNRFQQQNLLTVIIKGNRGSGIILRKASTYNLQNFSKLFTDAAAEVINAITGSLLVLILLGSVTA